MLRLLLQALLCGTLVLQVVCTIPSVGTMSAEQIRDRLGDAAFKIILTDDVRLRTKNYDAHLANLSKYSALAAPDVQSLVADATVYPGRKFVRHFHPRSAEVVYVTRGSLLVRFEFEGLSGRRVENLVKPGEFVVIPHGLVHDAICKSKEACYFVAFFKSADPGLVVLDEDLVSY